MGHGDREDINRDSSRVCVIMQITARPDQTMGCLVHAESVNCHVHVATSFYLPQFLMLVCLHALLYVTADKHSTKCSRINW